ncbi:hypothetical protein U9M48_018861 [Paspalum notatum var. saurae]|uniref:Reverse transcriptase zinc-binding domain-containing protein n=1 Tax=Paspalum notatum var. saurae TaxID=547442 RepID=A0AAQ3TCT2_PASNO
MEIKSQISKSWVFYLKKWDPNTWLGDQPLKYQYSSLFNIVRKKNVTIADVLSFSPFNISFRRALTGNKLTEWHNLVFHLANVSLTEGNDMFRWNLHSNGCFTVQSIYKHLINNNTRVSQDVWRTRLPLKIKIFMWYIKRGVLLTKDNLNRRNWRGDNTCVFCPRPETIQHLFFECSYAKFLWRTSHIALGIIRAIYFCWEQQGLVGLYGYFEIKLFLRKVDQNHFCRFSSRELTGFVHWPSPSCNKVKSELKLLLKVVVKWRRI